MAPPVRRQRCPRFAPAVALLLAMPLGAAWAQSTETLSTPLGAEDGDVPAAGADVAYAVPDLAPAPAEAPKEPGFFTFRHSIALLYDYTYLSQDDVSVAQVGDQDSQWQPRSGRLSLLGTMGREYKVSYQFGGEYKGFDSNPEEDWQITDVALTFPLGGPANKLVLGKTKQPFAYEMVGDAANLPQAERVLSPFFVSRNMGARMIHVLGENKRGTLSYGAYNDTWDIQSKSSRGMEYAARATGLAWERPGGLHFLHLGAALRKIDDDKGVLRYRGRPESNVTDYFVDTGNFSAEGAMHYGLELLYNRGPFSLLAEYNLADVDAPAQGNPNFSGYYLTGSWVITGETRPYDRNVGYARRVIPTGRWGAPELVVRYSSVDLEDGPIQGGSFEKTYLGLNWWATKRWKFGIGWGRTWLDADGDRGVTDAVLTRFQWVY
jgi:phosphate-selective porin OprO/OprP